MELSRGTVVWGLPKLALAAADREGGVAPWEVSGLRCAGAPGLRPGGSCTRRPAWRRGARPPHAGRAAWPRPALGQNGPPGALAGERPEPAAGLDSGRRPLAPNPRAPGRRAHPAARHLEFH